MDSPEKIGEFTTQWLAAIVESSDDAIVSKTLDGIITSWNRGAERIFGYSAGEIIGKPILVLIPPDRLNEETEIIRRIRAGEHVEHFETIRRCKDGTLIDVSLTVSPIKDANGKIVGASKISRDITEKKRAEETKELLLHEIKHRVKNTLATVQSIATQTFRRAPASERDAFMARLQGLGRTYDLLSSYDWGRAPVHDIVQRAITPFQEKHHDRISISGPDASLDSGKSLLLSLVLHELGTNATKYGALSDQGGQVSVDWELIDELQTPGLKLCWRECGGPPVKRPRRKGFGSRLIQHATKHELGGADLNFAPDGVICTLSMGL